MKKILAWLLTTAACRLSGFNLLEDKRRGARIVVGDGKIKHARIFVYPLLYFQEIGDAIQNVLQRGYFETGKSYPLACVLSLASQIACMKNKVRWNNFLLVTLLVR